MTDDCRGEPNDTHYSCLCCIRSGSLSVAARFACNKQSRGSEFINMIAGGLQLMILFLASVKEVLALDDTTAQKTS